MTYHKINQTLSLIHTHGWNIQQNGKEIWCENQFGWVGLHILFIIHCAFMYNSFTKCTTTLWFLAEYIHTILSFLLESPLHMSVNNPVSLYWYYGSICMYKVKQVGKYYIWERAAKWLGFLCCFFFFCAVFSFSFERFLLLIIKSKMRGCKTWARILFFLRS